MAFGVIPAANFWPTNRGFTDMFGGGDKTLMRSDDEQFKMKNRHFLVLDFDESFLCRIRKHSLSHVRLFGDAGCISKTRREVKKRDAFSLAPPMTLR